MDNAKVIKNQLYDYKIKYIKKLKEEKLEGEIIKRKVRAEQEKDK